MKDEIKPGDLVKVPDVMNPTRSLAAGRRPPDRIGIVLSSFEAADWITLTLPVLVDGTVENVRTWLLERVAT